MNRDEMNRYCHEQILGKCWHEMLSMPARDGWDFVSRCSQCEHTFECEHDSAGKWVAKLPDYCSDLNAVALVEAKVIETCWWAYEIWLFAIVMGHEPLVHGGWIYEQFKQTNDAILAENEWSLKEDQLLKIATATALQRATACVKAWEGEDE